MRRRDAVPRGPWVLGLAGLVPFVFGLLGAQYAQSPLNLVANTIFFAYGAIILSFLGGTRWGFEVAARPELPGWFTLFLSIIPSILGTLAMIAYYQWPQVALGILGAGFFLMLVWDLGSTGGSTRRWPQWYRPLRIVLSLGVLILLALKAWLQHS
jgi:hypothetical protein